MQIAIAYDHRGIDGALASRFTTKVKQCLKPPSFAVCRKAAKTTSPGLQARSRRSMFIGDRLRTQRPPRTDGWNQSAEDRIGS